MNDQQPSDNIGTSLDTAEENRRRLGELMPEAFSEGRLDVEALKRTLGEDFIVEGGERYRLEWAGKSEAYKVLQTPTSATLRPERDKSVNFDTAEHVFIEGENLEVLKVLQKAYFGKVKLIYIDPPYNTGNDSFIYPDRFQESKEDYLKRVNELSDDGTLMREGFFRKNSRENGHYHSNWLNMMLPRLYIARNLLREDGVIFVSCDDNEVHNLRFLLNEIFGEANFIANVVWQKRYVSNVTAKWLSDMHDHILVYAKQSENLSVNLVDRNEAQLSDYKNPDDDPRGAWRAQDLSASKFYAAGRYSITTPAGVVVNPPPGRFWRCNREQYDDWIADGRIWFGKSGRGRPMLKAYLAEVQQGLTPNTWWDYTFAGHNKEATLEAKQLFDGTAPFDSPKPVALINRIIELATTKDSIIFDFFAGSGTTAEAVLRRNAADRGRRRSVSIQLPEKCESGSVANTLGFTNITEISRERIRRVIKGIEDAADLATPLHRVPGFRSFVLDVSNLKQWRGDGIETAEQLAEQIQMFVKSEKDGAETEDLLYELLLRFGQELTTSVETLEIASQCVFAIHDRKMVFILDSFVEVMIDPLLEIGPREIIALDSVFADSDELKTNLDLQCRDAGIKFTCA